MKYERPGSTMTAWETMLTLFVLLGLSTFGNACWPIEVLEPGEAGTPVTFARGETKVRVKPSAEGELKFGLYLVDETGETVGGATLHYFPSVLFVSFLERRGETLTKVATKHLPLSNQLFAPGTWEQVRVSHLDDVLEIQTKDEKATKNLVRSRHRLPLRIYAQALLGPSFHVSFHFLNDVINSNIISSRDNKKEFYVYPYKDFKLANMIMNVKGDLKIFNLTDKDLVPGRCNLLKYHSKDQIELFIPEERQCIRRKAEPRSKFHRMTFLSNAPVTLIFPNKYVVDETDTTIMKAVTLPACDSTEHKEGRVEKIGGSRSPSSELIPLGDRVEFALLPQIFRSSSRTFSFGVWLQELGHLTAGVQVSQDEGEDVRLDLYEVSNFSYRLDHSQSLDGVRLLREEWTQVYLALAQEFVEVGVKTSPGGNWTVMKWAFVLDTARPFTAFLWSKEELLIAKDYHEKELQALLQEYQEEDEGKMNLFFRPEAGFQAALVDGLRTHPVIMAKDVVLGKWNHILLQTRKVTGHLVFGVEGDKNHIVLPTQGFCPVMWTVYGRGLTGIYHSNIHTEWSLKRPMPKEGEVVQNERCVDAPGCLVVPVGIDGLKYFKFKSNQVVFRPVRNKPLTYSLVLLIILSNGPNRVTALNITRKSQGFFLVSDDLGINVYISGTEEFLKKEPPPQIVLRRGDEGYIVFESLFRDAYDHPVNFSFTLNMTLPEDTGDYALAYAFVNEWDLKMRHGGLVFDNGETSIVFRSSSNWTTSLSFYLLDAVTETKMGVIHVTHGPTINGVIFKCTPISPFMCYSDTITIPGVPLRPNQWAEITVQFQQISFRFGFRTLEDPIWRHVELSTSYVHYPLVATVKSLHYHEVIDLCQRENGQFPVADESVPHLVQHEASHQPEVAITSWEMAATFSVPVGRRSAIVLFGEKPISFALLQFSHLGGGVSSAVLRHVEIGFRKLEVIYIDNTNQDGISKVDLPGSYYGRKVVDLSARGPVEKVQVISDGSYWLSRACGQAFENPTTPTNLCSVGKEDVHELHTPLGDSVLFLRGTYGHNNVFMFFYHESGKISVRRSSQVLVSNDTVLYRIHNSPDEENFVAVTHTLEDLGRLDYPGPVQKVIVATKGPYICLFLVELC